MTAEMMMEARIALGVYLKTGVMSSKVRNTIADMTMFGSQPCNRQLILRMNLKKEDTEK